MQSVTRQPDDTLSVDEVVAVVSLLNSVWPSKEKSLAELVEGFPEAQRSRRVSYLGSTRASLRHLVWDGPELIAHALTFERAIIAEEAPMLVMALSGVCVAPEHRGKGLGGEIVRSTFERVDADEFSVSLFQTGVRPFYEALGARVVANQFVNSRNAEAPRARPWNDQWTMIYPRDHEWPLGLIDLNGPGY